MKTIQASDFKEVNNSIEYSMKNDIWSKETTIVVLMDEDTNKKDLDRMMPKINEITKWVDENKALFCSEILEEYYLEVANENLNDDEEALTEETFPDKLYLDNVCIYFRDGDGTDFDDFEASEDDPMITVTCLADRPYSLEFVYGVNYNEKEFENMGSC